MYFDTSSIKKILVIQLRAIGDVVLSTAAVSVLRKNMVNSEIHFLTSLSLKPLINDLNWIDDIIVYSSSPRNPLGIFKMLPKIRYHNYDLVIDYQVTPGTAFLTKFSGARYRLGWKIRGRQWAYNLFSSANQKQEYVARQKCFALTEIGINEVISDTRISVNTRNIELVEKYLSTLNINKNRLLINITPKGKRQSRNWLPEKIAALADLLIDKFNAVIFYNYGPGEKKYVQEVQKLNKNMVHILPDWNLGIFVAFLSKIDLHFSYDNGPKHLAISVGTPTLSLFATDPPILWNPSNDANHPYILADVPCKYCGLRNCELMICMKKIEPEDVLKKIEQIPALHKKLKSE